MRYTIHEQKVTKGWKVVDNHTGRAIKMSLTYEDADFEAKRLNDEHTHAIAASQFKNNADTPVKYAPYGAPVIGESRGYKGRTNGEV